MPDNDYFQMTDQQEIAALACFRLRQHGSAVQTETGIHDWQAAHVHIQ